MPAAPPEPLPGIALQRVDFYILGDAAGPAGLKYASRLAEREYLAGGRVLAWSEDAQVIAAFDDQLWSFSDRGFVPHEVGAAATAVDAQTPVILAAGTLSAALAALQFDLLLNLGLEVPQFAPRFARIAEIVDSDEGRRQAGRRRFKRYRNQGAAPVTHNVAVDQPLPAAD